MDILILGKNPEEEENLKDDFLLNPGTRDAKKIKWKDTGLDELIKKKLDKNDFVNK